MYVYNVLEIKGSIKIGTWHLWHNQVFIKAFQPASFELDRANS